MRTRNLLRFFSDSLTLPCEITTNMSSMKHEFNSVLQGGSGDGKAEREEEREFSYELTCEL